MGAEMQRAQADAFIRRVTWLAETPVAFQDQLLARCDVQRLRKEETLYNVGLCRRTGVLVGRYRRRDRAAAESIDRRPIRLQAPAVAARRGRSHSGKRSARLALFLIAPGPELCASPQGGLRAQAGRSAQARRRHVAGAHRGQSASRDGRAGFSIGYSGTHKSWPHQSQHLAEGIGAPGDHPARIRFDRSDRRASAASFIRHSLAADTAPRPALAAAVRRRARRCFPGTCRYICGAFLTPR
jgi:hypothetical protein